MSNNTIEPGKIILPDNLPKTLPDFVKRTNVADQRLVAKVLFATDDFFAPKDRLLKHEPPVFIVGKFDNNGKWMDGWETRRKRGLGHDYCIIQLAQPTRIAGMDIDTSHFTGNYPPSASIDALYAPELMAESEEILEAITQEQWDKKPWRPFIGMTPLKGHSHEFVTPHKSNATDTITHLRLNIYPDGGIARLRVYGFIQIENSEIDGKTLDMVAARNGGRAIACNDAHFGAVENLLLPNKAPNMEEGWETRRRREPGNDWCIIALGRAGIPESIEIDTSHFKGNYPDKVSVQAVYAPTMTESTLITQSMFWETLLEPQKTEAHTIHLFDDLKLNKPITHIKVNIFPDGGISRVRLYGKFSN
ncbi:allantoicase [Psychrobacter sp.]|uniref:allantoicase n=1 Tax=Psychrobacter sp. TaxID=56811 RepID=UPI0025D2ABDE|nr:allantoicase [Psychrobacter sp.]